MAYRFMGINLNSLVQSVTILQLRNNPVVLNANREQVSYAPKSRILSVYNAARNMDVPFQHILIFSKETEHGNASVTQIYLPSLTFVQARTQILAANLDSMASPLQ